MKTRVITLAFEFAAAFLFLIWGASRAPEEMPLHWGLDGEADRLGSPERWFLETSILLLVLLVVVVLVGLLVARGPASMLNIPNKEYWSRPENVQQARQLLLDDVFDVFGDVLLLILAIEVIAWFRARAGHLDFPPALFLLVLGVFVASIAWRLFKLPGRYAVPR